MVSLSVVVFRMAVSRIESMFCVMSVYPCRIYVYLFTYVYKFNGIRDKNAYRSCVVVIQRHLSFRLIFHQNFVNPVTHVLFKLYFFGLR